jgi:hypothetical protein
MAHHVPVAAHTEERRIPGHRLGEKDMLWARLRFARATVAAKATGLSDSQLHAKLVSSETSVGGLLTHLVTLEQHWFGIVLGGQKHPMQFGTHDPDGDWRVGENDDSTAYSIATTPPAPPATRSSDRLSLTASVPRPQTTTPCGGR